MCDAQCVVDVQHVDSRSADCRGADEGGPIPSKVFIPIVRAWVEQPNEFIGSWIVARCKRSLGGIARRAGETEVVEISWAAEFLGADVIEFVGKRRALLWQATIVTAITRPGRRLVGGATSPSVNPLYRTSRATVSL